VPESETLYLPLTGNSCIVVIGLQAVMHSPPSYYVDSPLVLVVFPTLLHIISRKAQQLIADCTQNSAGCRCVSVCN